MTTHAVDAPTLKLAELSLDDKYTREDGEVLLTGLQAVIRVVLDQMRADRVNGLHTAAFVSGYPGSPLGGIENEFDRLGALARDLDIIYQAGVNEELGATAVGGSQVAGKSLSLKYDGVVGMWYGKAPGLDRAADAIRHANYNGVTRTSGALAWVGDDPACKSSTIPSSSESLMADMFLPVLVPGNVQEVIDYGLHGVAMSRFSSLWTGIKVVTSVADAMGSAVVRRGGVEAVFPRSLADSGRTSTIDISFAARLAAEREIMEVRLPAALEYARANCLNSVEIDPQDAWLAIVVPSHTYYEMLGALSQLGLSDDDLRASGVRILRLGMLYPFDAEQMRSIARGVEEVLVIEERRPFLETFVRDALYGVTDAPRIVGKVNPDGAPLVPGFGALDADALTAPLRDRLSPRLGDRMAPAPAVRTLIPLAARAPFFCSGCPHNTGTRVPEGTMVGSGIGCHGMVGWMDPAVVGTITSYTQMGGEGAQFVGIAPFVEERHFTQNVGDGTFFHSGQLAVQAAIAAGVNMTYKLLFNDTIAMTGGQTSTHQLQPADVAAVLRRHGVAEVVITTDDLKRYRGVRLADGVRVEDRARILDVQTELKEVRGVTVLIHDQRCAAEARRMRKRGQVEDPPMRVAIIDRVCEGCGDCSIKSNCMSVQVVDTDLGSKRMIDQTSCNKDYSCLQGDCPSFVTLTPAKNGRLARLLSATAAKSRTAPSAHIDTKAPGTEVIDGDALPAPQQLFSADDFAMRMTGVGGTGVVTISQVLVTAAKVAGLEAKSMDQTGLAQKGGAVVSDVRISRVPIQRAGKLGIRGADLYLAFDAIVGATPTNLAAADETRTLALTSTSLATTADQIGHGGAPVNDPTPLVEAIARASRADLARSVDAVAACRRLFGDTTVANVFVLGAAFQMGGIPLGADAIEEALRLNGVAVSRNIQAFRWGRRWAISSDDLGRSSDEDITVLPQRLARRVRAVVGATPELVEVVSWRANDLRSYQTDRLAETYVDFVGTIAARSQRVRPHDSSLVEAVARNLYKLMAYKDEYEVARLLLDASAEADVATAIGGKPMMMSWNLHPPMLRALGMKKKIRLGRWFTPGFRALRALRRLRGTPFDLFGYAEVRRVERALVREYRRTLDEVTRSLTDDNFDRVVELAGLPDLVRGYEDVKMRNVSRYHEELDKALAELNAKQSTALAS